jgi:hypothetical protein
MSNVVSPRGPLPPRVYWRRRLLLFAVVVGVAVLIGQLFGGGDDTEPVADRARSAPTAEPTKPAAGDASRSRKRAGARPRAARLRQAPSSTLSGASGPLAQPTGECKASEVAVVPDVEDTDAFGPVPLRIGLSATGERACTFAVGPDSVAVRVTSGDDLIWETLHCGMAVPQRSVVVRPGWLSYVNVAWNGRRGSDSCGDGDEFAQPGYYWAEAAAIGGEPGHSQFELQTPPKPSPSPSPKESEEPGSEPEGAEPDDGETGSQQPGGAQQEDDAQDTGGQSGDGSGADGRDEAQQTDDEKPVDPSKVGG